MEHPSGALPWRELRTYCCDVVYGGRVSDAWDLRTMEELFVRFCSADVLVEGHVFCPGLPAYATPSASATVAEYQDYIEQLPLYDDPQLCGLPRLANTDSAIRQGRQLLSMLRAVLPVGDARLHRDAEGVGLSFWFKKYLQVQG